MRYLKLAIMLLICLGVIVQTGQLYAQSRSRELAETSERATAIPESVQAERTLEQARQKRLEAYKNLFPEEAQYYFETAKAPEWLKAASASTTSASMGSSESASDDGATIAGGANNPPQDADPITVPTAPSPPAPKTPLPTPPPLPPIPGGNDWE